MNFRLLTSYPRAAIGLLIACLAIRLALAQPAPTGTGPTPTTPPPGPTTAAILSKLSPPKEDVKKNDSPTPAETEAVNRFIKEATGILAKGEDSDAATAAATVARNELINASTSAKGATVGYLTNYLGSLSTELTKMIASPNVRVRVNAGIVAARVAENAKAVLAATVFQKTILTAMQDRCDAVALWGVKAAGSLMSTPGQAAPNPQLLAQIPATVKTHNLNGPITDEAYTALKETFETSALAAPPNAQALQQIVAELIQIFDLRVSSYQTTLPSDPSIEWRPCSFLLRQTGTGMWKVMNPAQQQQVMGLVAQLLTASAQAALSKDLPQESFEQLRTLLSKTCEAVFTLAGPMGNSTLYTSALDASKKVSNTNTPRSAVPGIIAPVVSDIQKAFPPSGALGAKP